MAAGEPGVPLCAPNTRQGKTGAPGRLCCHASSSSSGRPALGWQGRAELLQLPTSAVRPAAAKSDLPKGGRQGRCTYTPLLPAQACYKMAWRDCAAG